MPVTLHDFIKIFDRQAQATLQFLNKGAEHAAANGVDEQTFLHQWKLAEDMYPLAFQITAVANFVSGWSARAAGVDAPRGADYPTLTLEGARKALADASAFAQSITPEALAGRDDAELHHEIMPGMAPTLTVARWIEGFALTNVYFHNDMTYAILRANGVKLGKMDAFPLGL